MNWSATNPAVVTRYRKLHQNKSGTDTVGKKEKKAEKEAGVEVACRGHHRQEGIQEGENQGTKNETNQGNHI